MRCVHGCVNTLSYMRLSLCLQNILSYQLLQLSYHFSLFHSNSSSLKPLIGTKGIGGLIPVDNMLLLIIDAKNNKHAINMSAWVANMNFVQTELIGKTWVGLQT